MSDSKITKHGLYSTGTEPIIQGNTPPDPEFLTVLHHLKSPISGFYLHIPFCFHKCHYCDFYSIVDERDRQEAFLHRMMNEMNAWKQLLIEISSLQNLAIKTIFVGGGTPTLMKPELWQQLLQHMHQLFDFSGLAEFTVEANPETVTAELIDTLLAGGVNRISIGAQSFNLTHLKTLERWHDPDNVGRSIEIARAAGLSNINLDLIFGIPGQSNDEWEADLRMGISLSPMHLSCYSLMYEPNTPLTKKKSLGRLTPCDEDIEAEMYDQTMTQLGQAGYDQYEVSNYAKPGYRCMHNMSYWLNDNWLAFGPSASGHLEGLRWKQLPHLGKYLDSTGTAPLLESERLEPDALIGETLMLRLRLTDGVSHEWLASEVDEARRKTIDRYLADGLFKSENGFISFTKSGLMIADSVLSDLI